MSPVINPDSLQMLAECMRDGLWLRVKTGDFELDRARVMEIRSRAKSDAVVFVTADKEDIFGADKEVIVDLDDILQVRTLRR